MLSSLRTRLYPGFRGALFYAIYWGVVGGFEPFLNLFYLTNGLNSAQIGWMAAVLPFCTMVINPLISRLADRSRRRVAILAITCAGFGAALLLLGMPGLRFTFSLLLALYGLVSIFRSPVNPLADSLIAGMASRYQLDFGHMRLWGSLCFTITAVTFGALWQQSGFPVMFRVTAAGFLLVILAASLLDELPLPLVPPTAEHTDPAAHKAHNLALDPGLLCLIGGTFLLLGGLFMASTFGPVYVAEQTGSVSLVGSLTGFAALGEVPWMLFGRRIARRTGYTNMLLMAYALVAVGLAGYIVSIAPPILLSFAVLRGVGFGALLANTVTILNNRAPREMASTYQGILSAACWGLAPLLGGPFSGWLYQAYGPVALFLTASGLAVAAGALLLPTYRLWKAPAY